MEHQPVLLREALEALAIKPAGTYVDATFGRGGHSSAILERLGPRGRLFALDRDPAAVAAASAVGADARFSVVHGSFGRLTELVREAGITGLVDGILLDLGVSSPQLDEPSRGFSFQHDGPLDMRMNPHEGLSAAAWLGEASERDIAQIIKGLGEDRHYRRIARAIVAARAQAPIRRTRQLAEIIERAVPGREPGKHPATRTFQAIRIHINGELDELRVCLGQTVALLGVGGRVVVISFHSLEDRIVKRFMRDEARGDPVYAGLPQVPPQARPTLKLVGRAVRPGAPESERNPRARSAVMRVAERLA